MSRVTRRPQVGDRVKIKWGLGHAEGTVEDLYGPPGHPVYLVSVTIRGPRGEPLEEETTLSVPLDAIEFVYKKAAAG